MIDVGAVFALVAVSFVLGAVLVATLVGTAWFTSPWPAWVALPMVGVVMLLAVVGLMLLVGHLASSHALPGLVSS